MKNKNYFQPPHRLKSMKSISSLMKLSFHHRGVVACYHLPLPQEALFPSSKITLLLSQASNIEMVRRACRDQELLFCSHHKNLQLPFDQLLAEEKIGCVGCVQKVEPPTPEGLVRVSIHLLYRARLVERLPDVPDLAHSKLSFSIVEVVDEPRLQPGELMEARAICRQLLEHCFSLREMKPQDQLIQQMVNELLEEKNPSRFADTLARYLPLREERSKKILGEVHPVQRLRLLLQYLLEDLDLVELQQRIVAEVHRAIDKQQREYFLREQVKVIQKELGEEESSADEVKKYLDLLKNSSIPAPYHDQLEKEIRKLSKYPFGFPEAGVLRNYLDLVFELPWGVYTTECNDISSARKQLERDHYGLTSIKERILEYMAVHLLQQRQAEGEGKAPILCFVGPPGVGKTSIARSIAKALGRNYVRMSLGGVRDEAEIRGHRRTYIGAMPGRMLTALRQAKSSNPLILLDEIDKLGNDFRGDPASALLEVLDPAQNHSFRDHFLELPYDFSHVLFITTANTTASIPAPLLDRMEVIELTAYTNSEKIQIAKRHLLPRLLAEHGLEANAVKIAPSVWPLLLNGYTREGGVRNLERELAKLCRRAALQVLENEKSTLRVSSKNLQQLLGVPRFSETEVEKQDRVGLVHGLAWTAVGGVMLPIEVSKLPGTGKIELTGRLGEVMKESAKVALSYVRSVSSQWKLDPGFYQNHDLHIHLPEGAVPKDGPSAGIALVTGLLSALTGRAVRHDVAMTGEVTIRGQVLPIGGLKEKLLAAQRNGMRQVFIPQQNAKDLQEIPDEVRSALDLVLVEHVEEVLPVVLLPEHKS